MYKINKLIVDFLEKKMNGIEPKDKIGFGLLNDDYVININSHMLFILENNLNIFDVDVFMDYTDYDPGIKYRNILLNDDLYQYSFECYEKINKKDYAVLRREDTIVKLDKRYFDLFTDYYGLENIVFGQVKVSEKEPVFIRPVGDWENLGMILPVR